MRARFPRLGDGRDTSLWFSGTVRQDRNVGCWKWNEKRELGWLAGREWQCLWRLPGKIQNMEGVPPGVWVLPFVLRTGDKISWRTGGAFCHALPWYHHRQNVKPVSPSIEEGLSLRDKLLREGINTLSFYLHCPHILSLESLLLAGEAITGVKNEFVFSFFLFFLPHSVACGSQFPNRGLNLCLLHWKHTVVSTRPPGKSQTWVFTWRFVYCEYNPRWAGGGKKTPEQETAAQQQLWHFSLTRKTSG